MPHWKPKKYGLQVGETWEADKRVHYLSFADDTTLLAKSKSAMRKMIADIKRELAVVGLKLNSDKCKIQCSVGHPHPNAVLTVDGDEFPIVAATQGFDLLGTVFTLTGGTKEEVKHRIRIAWGKFYQIWPMLRHRASSLGHRLRLFNAVVGRSLLWGSESWTLTVTEKQKLQAVQRSMMRRFAAPARLPDEEWVPWIRRATRIAVRNAEAAGVKSWVHQHLLAKWRWAGHVSRMAAYRDNSWAYIATFWRDAQWTADNARGSLLFSSRPLRSRAGRWSRWEDEIVRYCADWRNIAGNKQDWSKRADAFMKTVWK
jgi:hypothetical protein